MQQSTQLTLYPNGAISASCGVYGHAMGSEPMSSHEQICIDGSPPTLVGNFFRRSDQGSRQREVYGSVCFLQREYFTPLCQHGAPVGTRRSPGFTKSLVFGPSPDSVARPVCIRDSGRIETPLLITLNKLEKGCSPSYPTQPPY